jgi:predicted O-methyltransferase YrrM
MHGYNYKLKQFLITELGNINNPNILEFGVKEGRSTKIFLDYCEKNNGNLYSIDVNDYSDLFLSTRWKFIRSRDDDFEYLKNIIPYKFDIIYLDSLHEAAHVEKIFYHYYKSLKLNGIFFIDDISWLPYLKNTPRDNFYCEINNKETFERLIEIYYSNNENFDIFFTFISSGMCKIVKKKENLNKLLKMSSRENSIKNFLRKILK